MRDYIAIGRAAMAKRKARQTIACAICDDCGPDYSTFRHPYLCKWCYEAKKAAESKREFPQRIKKTP